MSPSQFTISDDAHEFIREQLSSGQFSSPDEVVSKTLEEARIRQATKKLAVLLQEGLDSGPGILVTENWRKAQRTEFLAKLPPGTAE